jgi:hypothetical protein
MVWLGIGWYWPSLLWNLCDYFVPLCAFVIKLCDILKCTCWVPTISVLNLAISPCYSNLLLRRRRWTGILQRGVLGYVLPRLPFLWCYWVFHCSVSLRVILVFKNIIYVIIILYIHDIWLFVSTFGRMCGIIDPRSCIRWVLWFWHKTGYDSCIMC